jgi:Carboxypeptidase regulatory-like domain/CarboxypepD_reg-like domain
MLNENKFKVIPLDSVALISRLAVEQIRHRVAIAGSVTDAITEQRIAGAVVEVVGQNLQTQTREDGSFYFIDLPDGQYTLKVSAPNLGSRYGTANVANVTVKDENGRLIFDSQANVKLSPTRLIGQVKRSDNNQPIANALVQLRGSETQTLTNKEGRYVLSGIQASQPRVQVSVNGFVTQIQQVKEKLIAGQEQAVEFRLVPSS